MDPDDRLEVELPREYLAGTVSQLLDRVFPPDNEGRRPVSDRFDLRANPDLPDIYAVLLAVCDEWRDWRCALVASAGGEPIELDAPASHVIQRGEGVPVLQLRLEQEHRALEYAVRQGLWPGHEELLSWMQSLVALYFLDKHEAVITSPASQRDTAAMARAIKRLEAQGIIAWRSACDIGAAGDGAYAITAEGRRFISRLLAETESYIELYDHYRDVLADPDAGLVEFEKGRGTDLRVEVFLAEGLDPVRTVFLLRLYDGTLDARVRDWVEAVETADLFEGVLEPVVNRDSVSPERLAAIIEHGHAWLEEQREKARRDEEDRDLLRRAGGEAR